ncbi:MAG: hypothetical protein D3913_12250 [Candidatus Electrothrix sp. LOE1_4_5]|nr:hypothetical protein [Candidatus Electrothrix gigas]
MAHCKQQMPYMQRAIRLGRQHIPCRRLPALFFTSACLQIFQEERVQRDAVLFMGCDQEVNMVGHQDIGMDIAAVFFAGSL